MGNKEYVQNRRRWNGSHCSNNQQDYWFGFHNWSLSLYIMTAPSLKLCVTNLPSQKLAFSNRLIVFFSSQSVFWRLIWKYNFTQGVREQSQLWENWWKNFGNRPRSNMQCVHCWECFGAYGKVNWSQQHNFFQFWNHNTMLICGIPQSKHWNWRAGHWA